MARLWIYLVPLTGLAIVVGAVYWLMFTEHDHIGAAPSSAARNGDVLILLCAESVRPPVAGTALEHGGGVIDLFERRTGLRIEPIYDTPHTLLQKLRNGEPGDLFIPGDTVVLEQARREGLVESVHTIATLVPVIMVRRGNPLGIEGVRDLVREDVRIAVADDQATDLGSVTARIFHQHDVSLHEAANIALTVNDANELAQAINRGRADAAIVWRAVAKQHPGNSRIIELPDEPGTTVPLVLAVLTTSTNQPQARQFAGFMTGRAAGDVLAGYQFQVQEQAPDNGR